MLTSRFDIDDDRKDEIIIKGGVLALIATVIIADLMITGGEFTLGLLDSVLGLFP